MYDGRYTVKRIDEAEGIAYLEYRPDLPLVKIPQKYTCKFGTIGLDPGDAIHLYPAENKLIIMMAPGFIEEYVQFELDLGTGDVKEFNPPVERA